MRKCRCFPTWKGQRTQGRAAEGTPGLFRTEPPLCKSAANSSGTVFRPYDRHTAGKPTFALVGKPTPNQLTINKLKENQLKGASEKPPAPFGRYQNVLLSESEYAELKEEYPDRLERLIEEMSEYIAASGNDYVCHAAALRRWLDREKKEKPKKGIPDYFYKEGESL